MDTTYTLLYPVRPSSPPDSANQADIASLFPDFKETIIVAIPSLYQERKPKTPSRRP
jgi:hypothetical protein